MQTLCDATLHSTDRDLSVSNILIARDMVAKIADFGLATHTGSISGATDTNLTMCGTANFMAPEIVLQQVHGLAAGDDAHAHRSACCAECARGC